MKKEKIEKFVEEKFKEHGLYNSWSFEWSRAKRRGGSCSYRKKVIRLSEPLALLNDIEFSKSVILHEIAHALVGAGHGHNHIWKRKAIEIGDDGQRCYSSDIKQPEPKYIYECPNCKREVKRHRQIRRPIACGKCCRVYNNGRFSDKYILIKKK